MSTVSMHAEMTADPAVMKWIVRDGVVSGLAVLAAGSSNTELPPEWNAALLSDEILEIAVADGYLRVRVADPQNWRTLAPRLQKALAEYLKNGNTIAITTPPRSDEELAAAVQELLAGPLASYVASHGGMIELDSVVDAVVTVRMSGACKGCSAAGVTLKQGIEDQLRENYPEIKGVRSLDDKGSRRNLAENGRRLLPFVS